MNANTFPFFFSTNAGCTFPLPIIGWLARHVSPSSSEIAINEKLYPSEYKGNNILPLFNFNAFILVIQPILLFAKSLLASIIISSYLGAYEAKPVCDDGSCLNFAAASIAKLSLGASKILS